MLKHEHAQHHGGRCSQAATALTVQMTPGQSFGDTIAKRIIVEQRVDPSKRGLSEVNQKGAYRAKDADELALDRPDEADAQILNAILWHAIKGSQVAMPGPKTAFRSHPLQDD
jgi:hypothetical protein